MNSHPSSERSIHIGGSATGSTFIMGDGNHVVNTQLSQPAGLEGALPKRKLLVLAANPRQTMQLRLDEEVREISEGLKRSRHRDKFEIAQRWAVRPRDFQRAMLEEAPQLVHFSGHGEGEAGLYFEDEGGYAKPVMGEALGRLFGLFADKNKIECVLLNGCYSQAQAEAIVQHVPFVVGVQRVGMQAAVGDGAAIAFAVGFYDALGNGESVRFAFDAGKVAMLMEGTGYGEMPILLTG